MAEAKTQEPKGALSEAEIATKDQNNREEVIEESQTEVVDQVENHLLVDANQIVTGVKEKALTAVETMIEALQAEKEEALQ